MSIIVSGTSSGFPESSLKKRKRRRKNSLLIQ